MADITASRIQHGAILIWRKDPGYIDLGDDVIVISWFICDWEKFISDINEVYNKHLSLNPENGNLRDIREL